ncbi:60S Ribosomal protein [Quillaja saponaria]|uniref:60S Ribosomal protein n=1 Tax=Quillaja saponaria TaxID=32244 RepID=A0AAD7QHD9_QUISA|nr:60S Ribosomal protein [Quillaja saponaria]
MAQQAEGWPLGLQPLNVRTELARNRDYSGSVCLDDTLSWHDSDADDLGFIQCIRKKGGKEGKWPKPLVPFLSPNFLVDRAKYVSKSTGSFFHDKSITLGSLIGVSSILELSRRSLRGRKTEILKNKKSNKSRTWLFSLCSRDSTDAENVNNNTSSLGHFLSVERRAANERRRNPSPAPVFYGPDEFTFAQTVIEPDSLFVNGCVAPPPSSPCFNTDADQRRGIREVDHCNELVSHPVKFPCICG